MKVALEMGEKIRSLAGITLFGVVLSSLIGKRLIPQSLLTFVIFYLLTGKRPVWVFAFVKKFRRDIL